MTREAGSRPEGAPVSGSSAEHRRDTTRADRDIECCQRRGRGSCGSGSRDVAATDPRPGRHDRCVQAGVGGARVEAEPLSSGGAPASVRVAAAPVSRRGDIARVTAPVAATAASGGRHVLSWQTIAALAWLATGLGAVVALRKGRPGAARMMTAHVVPPEDPRRGGVAIRERSAPHRACGRVRRSVGCVRALSPSPRRRRADGVRDGRARHTDHGRRRSRGGVSS